MSKSGYMIEIAKDGNIIGACYYNHEIYNTLDTLEELKTMIDNYNKRLVNADLSNEDLAVCMFMQSDENGKDPLITGVSLFEDSFEYMKNAFKRTYPYYEDDDIGYAYVGITKEDISYIEKSTKYAIYIDMDRKAVGVQTLEIIEDFELPHMLGLTSEEVDFSKIERTDMNPDFLLFYEISDFIKLIIKSDGIFKEEDRDDEYVFVALQS